MSWACSAISLANAVFQKVVRRTLTASFSAAFLGRLKVSLEHDSKDGSYTWMVKPGHAAIHIGLGLAVRAAGMDVWDKITSDAKRAKAAKLMKLAMEGLAYHEIGHLKKTDMTGQAFEAVDPSLGWAMGFIKDVANIMEDPKMERLLYKDPLYGFTKPMFRFLTRRLFAPRAKAYKDGGNAASLLEYLLLYLRCGPQAIGSRNAMYDSLIPKGIEARMRDAYRENDAKERARKQVAFAIWLISELGLKKSDLPTAPQTSPRPVVMIIGDGKTPQALQPDGDGDGDGAQAGQVSQSGQAGESQDPTAEGDANPDGEQSDETDQSGEGDGCGYGPGGQPPQGAPDEGGQYDWEIGNDPVDEIRDGAAEAAADAGIDALLASDANILDGKESTASDDYDVKHEYSVDTIWSSCVKALGDSPANLAEALKELKSEAGEREVTSLPDGESIDIDAYIDETASGSKSMEVYMDEETGRRITDLAVSILIDCSGSMEGAESLIAFHASSMAALACEESDVPCEIAAFSDKDVLWLKRFDDPMSVASKYLPIAYSEAAGYYATSTSEAVTLWGGTELECALPTVLRSLMEYDGRACKLLFIITDGDTGDTDAVRSMVDAARADGIAVVGIGIGVSTMRLKSCFGHCSVFTQSSLAGLPEYVAGEIRDALASDGLAGY